MKAKIPYDPHARYITPSLLRDIGVFTGTHNKIIRAYPSGLKLTVKNLRTMLEMGASLSWWIVCLTNPKQHQRYWACDRVNSQLWYDDKISHDEFLDRLARKAYQILTTEWK